jgi:translation initiation factor IF-1
MRISQTIREINRGDLLIVKPWIWKPVIVFVWAFLWVFYYFAFLKDVVELTPKIFSNEEPSEILAFLAIFGFLILSAYWTTASIYYHVIKDRNVRLTINHETLTIIIGRHSHHIRNEDIIEIRLKKIADSKGGHSFNVSVVSKESQLFLLIKSDDEISYELADRLNQMTNAEISIC